MFNIKKTSSDRNKDSDPSPPAEQITSSVNFGDVSEPDVEYVYSGASLVNNESSTSQPPKDESKPLHSSVFNGDAIDIMNLALDPSKSNLSHRTVTLNSKKLVPTLKG
jgi:hypothetical protein